MLNYFNVQQETGFHTNQSSENGISSWNSYITILILHHECHCPDFSLTLLSWHLLFKCNFQGLPYFGIIQSKLFLKLASMYIFLSLVFSFPTPLTPTGHKYFFIIHLFMLLLNLQTVSLFQGQAQICQPRDHFNRHCSYKVSSKKFKHAQFFFNTRIRF